MQKPGLLILFVLGLLATAVPVAQGQVQLIVRPVDGAADQFFEQARAGKADLPGGVAANRSRFPQLFAEVDAARALVPQAASAKSGQRPFPAFVLTLPDSTALDAALSRWSSREDVAYAQPNAVYTLDGASVEAGSTRGGQAGRSGQRADLNDPLADSLGHLRVIRAHEAWAVTTGSPDVRVGLIDTGVFLDHPDLVGQFAINAGEDLNGNGRVDPSDFNGVDDDGNGYVDDIRGYDFVDRPGVVEEGDYRNPDPDPSADPDGPVSEHGTIVGGAIAAARNNGEGIAGVAPDSRLVPLRAFAGDGRGTTADIAAAIVYAADQGLDVVNLSFGRDIAAPLLKESVEYAVSRGTVVVASAGNNGGDSPHYPSDYPEVISTAWLTQDGTAIAARGEYGVGIDIGAPGSFIYTTTQPPPPDEQEEPPGTSDFYGRRSGSSMAAPMVAGTAALLRAADASLSPASIRSILTSTAADIDAPGWDHRTASGRLDAGAALRQQLPARTEITQPAHNGGVASDTIAVTGSAVDPSFASYRLDYARGAEDLDRRTDPWTSITSEQTGQVYQDTLGVWRAGGLEEGLYTLRLVTTRQSGRTVEDRRRVYVDRTPPTLSAIQVERGLVGERYGVVAEVRTDDRTTVQMRIDRNGATATVASETEGRQHGLAWPDPRGTGGTVGVTLRATNTAGLTTTRDTSVMLTARQTNSALFATQETAVPGGFALPRATDFDGDGLRELTFNQFEEGGLGDTLSTYEWDGSGFRVARKLVANLFPRASGDTDGDGLQEVLLQLAGGTLLLEQSGPSTYPDRQQFVDTTGLADLDNPDAVWGARLTDLDEDGQGEILSHNTKQWRLLELQGDGTYAEAVRIGNPTEPNVDDQGRAQVSYDSLASSFGRPEALVGDFDDDGRRDVLVGDTDGDWVMYEADGAGGLRVAWTYTTDRSTAGARFAQGDLDGDGATEFVTFTENLSVLRPDGRQDPPLGRYYIWSAVGDDQYALEQTIPVQGRVSPLGAMATIGVPGSSADRLVIAHPPDVYVISLEDGAWRLAYHRGRPPNASPRARSARVTTGDFDGDGTAEFVTATAAGTFARFAYQQGAAQQPPPVWRVAQAADASSARLTWRAPAADSVTVFAAAPPEGDLDPLATTADSALVVPTTATRAYALRAWYDGTASPLSETRRVRPHAPARIIDVGYPSPQAVRLQFSEPIAATAEAAQFALDNGPTPESLLRSGPSGGLVVQFDRPLSGRRDTLRWTGLRDTSGVPVGQTAVALSVPPAANRSLIVRDWTIDGNQAITLTFSAPLRPEAARDTSRFQLRPYGRIQNAEWQSDQPRQVRLTLDGIAIGATGQAASLTVTAMEAVDGAQLAEEGRSIALSEPADGLDEVYVYPNPYRARQHEGRVTVAGLPRTATVRVIHPSGRLVRVLSGENIADGGLAWDLRNRQGSLVPSGIYLIRVEAPDEEPVTTKAAIIR